MFKLLPPDTPTHLGTSIDCGVVSASYIASDNRTSTVLLFTVCAIVSFCQTCLLSGPSRFVIANYPLDADLSSGH